MEHTLEPQWYFSVLRRWLWLIALCTLLGAAGAFLVASRMPSVYSASATLLVQPSPTASMSDYTAIRASELLASTYSQMLSGQPVMEAVVARLGLEETPDALAGKLRVELIPDAQLIRSSVEDTDPARAALIANTVVEVFIAQNEELQMERYAESLASIEEQIGESSALIKETEAAIDALNTRVIQDQTELTRLEAVLGEYRSTHATLQRDYGQMRLTAAQATNNVIVVETAQAPEGPVEFPYSASAILLVQHVLATSASDYTAILTSEQMARTYSQMFSSRPVMEAVIARLGLRETPAALARGVKAEVIPNTQLIRLSVEYTDPSQAAIIANTIAEAFIVQIKALQQDRYTEFLASLQERLVESLALIEETEAGIDALYVRMIQEQTELARLETVLARYRSTHATLQENYGQMRLTAAQATDNVIITETAQVPKNPVGRSTLYTILAAVVGAMLAVAVAFLVEYLDDTMKTPEDVSQTLGLDAIGAIGRLAKQEEELVVATRPLSPVAEAFRVLYTNVRFSSVDRPLRTLLVTSSSSSEGKSTTLANLAAAMAQAGLKVVAVDADLRRPRLHELFGLDPRAGAPREKLWWGLTGSLLEGNTNGLLQPTQVEGLRILVSGEVPPNSAGLVGSQRMRELLDELAQQADVVLIDSPPVLPVADAALLAQEVDGTLLVIDAGQTRRVAARHAVERLQQVRANLIGAVLNGVSSRDSYYSYHEAYENGNGRRKHRRRRRTGPLAAGRRLLGRRWKAD